MHWRIGKILKSDFFQTFFYFDLPCRIMWVGLIGSAVSSFIGYKQTNKHHNRQTMKVHIWEECKVKSGVRPSNNLDNKFKTIFRLNFYYCCFFFIVNLQFWVVHNCDFWVCLVVREKTYQKHNIFPNGIIMISLFL